MKPWLVFDTEDNSEHLLATGQSGFLKKITQIAAKTHDGKTYYSRGDVSGFRKWLSQFQGCQAWYHAGGGAYDLGALFADTIDDLDITLVGQRLVKARWRGVEFLDSYNLYPSTLAEIAESFETKKLKRDVHSRSYVMRDVEILHAAIDFAARVAEENGVELGATIGGLSLKIWKERGGQNWQDGFFETREAYIGGRAEIFRESGCGRLVKCDINSLYPWALTQPFPEPLEKTNDLTKTYGIVSVRVEQNETDLAVLPVRQWDGSLLYPKGKFNGIWTLHELRSALSRGARVLRVFDAWGTDRAQFYYRDFVEKFYCQKSVNDNDPVKRSFFKTMLNSFVGQIASRGEVTRSVDIESAHDYDGIPYGTKKLIDIQTPLGKHVNYTHASYVNSYARLRLLEYLEKIGVENLVYCKTDSVFFLAGKSLPFENSKNLGEMRIEEDLTHGEFQCHEIDIYQFGNTYVAKGVPKRFARDYVTRGTAKFQVPYRLRESIRYYNHHNRKKLGIWRTVAKSRKTKYSKKDLGRDGRYHPKTVNFKKYYSRMETEKASPFEQFLEY